MQWIKLEQALTRPKYLVVFLLSIAILAELICLSLAGSLTYLFKYGLTFKKPALVYYSLSGVFIGVYVILVVNMLSYAVKRAWLKTIGRALIYLLVLLAGLALICLIGLSLALTIWFGLSYFLTVPVPSLDNGLFSSLTNVLWLAGAIFLPYGLLSFLFLLIQKIGHLI